MFLVDTKSPRKGSSSLEPFPSACAPPSVGGELVESSPLALQKMFNTVVQKTIKVTLHMAIELFQQQWRKSSLAPKCKAQTKYLEDEKKLLFNYY